MKNYGISVYDRDGKEHKIDFIHVDDELLPQIKIILREEDEPMSLDKREEFIKEITLKETHKSLASYK